MFKRGFVVVVVKLDVFVAYTADRMQIFQVQTFHRFQRIGRMMNLSCCVIAAFAKCVATEYAISNSKPKFGSQVRCVRSEPEISESCRPLLVSGNVVSQTAAFQTSANLLPCVARSIQICGLEFRKYESRESEHGIRKSSKMLNLLVNRSLSHPAWQ